MTWTEKLKTAVMVIALGSACGFAFAVGSSGDDDLAVVQRDQNGQKTGLVLFTDVATGCQYVRTIYRDGITPRLGKDGKQVCG